MLSPQKIQRTKCSACSASVNYGIKVLDRYIFCDNICLSKLLSIVDLVNLYKTAKQ